MRATITPTKLSGNIRAIPSKSAAHRALICAAFADSPTLLTIDSLSDDIEATLRCLGELGVRYAPTDNGFYVMPIDSQKLATSSEELTLDCGESGSTLRFMLPVACTLGAPVSFTGHGRLPERPLSPLYEELVAAGATLSPAGSFPLKAQGPLTCNHFHVAGNISSQYITGLLLAAPLMGGADIEVTEPIESQPYIQLTLRVMEQFGISVEIQNGKGTKVYHVQAQGYHSPREMVIEGDWSNAAFWLCAGAISNSAIAVSGLDAFSAQGDRAVMAALSLFGAQIVRKQGSVAVLPAPLKACALDCRDIPDLVAPLAVVAACAEGKTIFKGAERLKLKESDRLLSIAGALNSLGAKITVLEDGLLVEGTPQLSGGTANAANDHRIAMMCAIASLRCDSAVQIEGAEAVRKSYPAFFEDFATLGGNVELEED